MTQNPYQGPRNPNSGGLNQGQGREQNPGPGWNQNPGQGWEQNQGGGQDAAGGYAGGYGYGYGGHPGQAPDPYAGGQTPYPAAGYPGGQDQWQAPPSNNMVFAILTTVFCCLPLGIVSIVKANQVNAKVAQGDLAGATKSATDARNFAIAAAAIGAVFGLIYILVLGFGDF